MGLQRSAIYKWFHEERDPTAETVAELVKALKELNVGAAEEFVQLYLGDIIGGEWLIPSVLGGKLNAEEGF